MTSVIGRAAPRMTGLDEIWRKFTPDKFLSIEVNLLQFWHLRDGKVDVGCFGRLWVDTNASVAGYNQIRL